LQAGWRAARLGLLVDARDVAQAFFSGSAVTPWRICLPLIGQALGSIPARRIPMVFHAIAASEAGASESLCCSGAGPRPVERE
jgi:hypothetical protein